MPGMPGMPGTNMNGGLMGSTGAYGSTMNSGYGTGYGLNSGYGTGSSYGSSYGSPYNRMGMGSSMYGSSYGTGAYGSSYGSSYSSPYSRMGMGSSMYGSTYGTGGYGSSYGGYGMNRMGMGMNGMGMNGPMGGEDMSLMQRMEQGSMPTFQLIESVVGAFGGFAQMLESTYMATHSSFMAMVGVAEQFGHLRGYLGQVLGLFGLLRWAKGLLYRLLGKKMPEPSTAVATITNSAELSSGNFQDFQEQVPPPRVSKRPLIILLFVVFGLPYLMGRLVRAVSNRQTAMNAEMLMLQQQQQQHQQQQFMSEVAPQNLSFARAMYDFNASGSSELTLRQGDVIAILSRVDQMGQESQWWMGRNRNGAVGLFPAAYVEMINKNSYGQNGGLPAPGTPANAQSGLDHAAFDEFKF